MISLVRIFAAILAAILMIVAIALSSDHQYAHAAYVQVLSLTAIYAGDRVGSQK